MDRLTEMEAYIAVLEQGGFTDAARRLGLSKSAVSKYISALEQRLGARLLERTTRRVAATELGLAYYDRARRVVTAAGDADALVTALRAPPAGLVRLAAPRDFGLSQLVPRLPEYLRLYPQVTVDLVLAERPVELVAEGFDMAIRLGPPPEEGGHVQQLAQASRRLIATPEYLALHGRPSRLDDLSAHRLLHQPTGADAQTEAAGGGQWQITSPTGERRVVRAGGWLAVNDGSALLSACVAGLGIAYLPSFLCAAALARGTVVEVIPALRPERFAICAISAPGGFAPPKLRSLSTHLRAAFATEREDFWAG